MRAKKRIVIKNKTRFIAALSAVLLLGALIVAVSGGAAAVRPERETIAYTVCSGDTLWEIGRRFAPADTDVRYYIEQIAAANSLSGSDIFPDQVLILP
ncbi:MAG: LysM peptidoglycan-binding domain-containing protein [Eubacteriales bacterium]|nr:LysM peptidoglycan-binding domain-containing protein [Eubacteriales bacterium]